MLCELRVAQLGCWVRGRIVYAELSGFISLISVFGFVIGGKRPASVNNHETKSQNGAIRVIVGCKSMLAATKAAYGSVRTD
jgi:hypothetical protein